MDTDNFLGGFEAVAGTLSNRTVDSMEQKGNFDEEDSKYDYKEPEEIEEEEEKVSGKDDSQKKTKTPKTKETEETEEEEEEYEEEEEQEEEEEEGGEEGDSSDLGEAEPEISQYVQDKLGELLGWEFGEDEKFKSMEDVVNFMKEVVEVNSTPQFANEEMEKLNEFISNGGDIREYIQTSAGEVDLDTVDLSDDKNQKAVISELLKEQGYSESRIKRSIERYEDAGVLEDEAEDAKELLAEIREKKSEKLLKEKQKAQEEAQKQQQKYIETVQDSVNSLESVRGIPISKEEKKQLMDYIFKPTADGRTKYQKDYLSDSKNLIESAYFTMKGDAFVQKVQRKANSDAAKNLKKKLSDKSKRTKENKNDSNFVWDSLSSQLRKPKY